MPHGLNIKVTQVTRHCLLKPHKVNLMLETKYFHPTSFVSFPHPSNIQRTECSPLARMDATSFFLPSMLKPILLPKLIVFSTSFDTEQSFERILILQRLILEKESEKAATVPEFLLEESEGSGWDKLLVIRFFLDCVVADRFP